MTLEDIRAACYGARADGIDVGMIVIDYLQLILTKGENRVREVAEVTRGLKLLAKSMGCPLMLLSQLSRENERRADRRPILSDLRESGSIEQDADVVFFIYRDEYYFPDSEKKNVGEIIIAKQRNGLTGSVDLSWFGESTTFRNKENFHETDEEPPRGWS